MFPKRKINPSLAHDYYEEAKQKLDVLLMKPKPTEISQLASALDPHFAAIGAMLHEFQLSIDMLFERIDNLERRLR